MPSWDHQLQYHLLWYHLTWWHLPQWYLPQYHMPYCVVSPGTMRSASVSFAACSHDTCRSTVVPGASVQSTKTKRWMLWCLGAGCHISKCQYCLRCSRLMRPHCFDLPTLSKIPEWKLMTCSSNYVLFLLAITIDVNLFYQWRLSANVDREYLVCTLSDIVECGKYARR